MSGGVDSSVAAALLAEQGHEVIGLSMQLYDQRGSQTFGSCCTLDDLYDARRVAAHCGFPHYIVNFEEQFQKTVIANFVDEYTAGRTPIPCSHCNSDLKFATLLDRARGLGSAHVATGHYACVTRGSDDRWQLRRSTDRDKDQSYFLFSLTQAQLAGAVFPVGDMPKAEVRDHARRLGLLVAEKPDSHEICFVPDGDYASFVEARAPSASRAGTIVDQNGRALGAHGGVHRFTVGQRKGLGVASPEPLYVLRINAGAGQVTVGPRAALERRTFSASGMNWMAIDAPGRWLAASAQVRHGHRAATGRVQAMDGLRAEFEFDEPQQAITPGQAAVFYDGDVVLGGGWID